MALKKISCLLALCFVLSGCGLAAAPCRLTGAVVKVVPVVGGAAGAVFDACGDIID